MNTQRYVGYRPLVGDKVCYRSMRDGYQFGTVQGVRIKDYELYATVRFQASQGFPPGLIEVPVDRLDPV